MRALRLGAQLTVLLGNVFELHPQTLGGQNVFNAFGPFDNQRASVKHCVEVELFALCGGFETIGVHVKKLRAIGAAILVDQNKSGTRNRVERAPALRDALHERGLARAEVALQADEVALFEQSAEAHAHAPRLFGTAADEIEAVLCENGHAEIIPRGIWGKPARNSPDFHIPSV